MQKNSITSKITPCCGLPFSVVYWWVSNLILNSETDRQFILSKISQNGTLSIDGWKVLINSGKLEADVSLTKAEFLAWFDCGKQPTCEQLRLIIEGFKVGNWTPEINSLLENYYTKNETYSQTEINGFLSDKLDKGTYTGTASDLKNEIDGKLNKPTTTSNTTSYPFVVGEDGNGNSARLPAGDLGKNFFNSDLSNTTDRNHTMNAGVTVNTLGNPHTLSGLPNKNTDIANFRKVRVQNTSGLDSVVDSKNLLTDGVTSMTDAEKDAWRIANRKTGETYSTGSPQVNAILPPVINGNETFNQFITVVGLNLFVNNSTPSTANLEIRRVKDIHGNTLSTPDVYTGLNIEVSQNNPTILSASINFSAMPKGYYKAFVTHNGLTNLTSPEFFVGNAISTIPLPSPFWIEQINGTPTAISNTQISSNHKSPTTYKSDVITNASLLQNGFIAEFTCEFSGAGVGNNGSTGSGIFGVIGADNVIYGVLISSMYSGSRYSNFIPDNSVMNTSGTIGLTNKMYIIYKNDIVTVINQSTGKVKSFIDPSFKTTNKKAYYSMIGVSGNYSNSGSMTFNNIKSF